MKKKQPAAAAATEAAEFSFRNKNKREL